MRRRLNIACGILHRPRIVLLDEPTVGVDPQSRDRIYDMLGALARSGVSLLLTTHHLEEAEARCSRTVIIDHGKVIAVRDAAGARRSDGRPHRLVTLRLDAPLDGDAGGHSPAARRDRRRSQRTPGSCKARMRRRRRSSCRRCSNGSAWRDGRSTMWRSAVRACSRCSSISPEGSCASNGHAAARSGCINLRRDRVAQALTFVAADRVLLDLRHRVRRPARTRPRRASASPSSTRITRSSARG